jgi:DNA-directed RNA polymerase subunit RPC12/RpoP
MRVQNLHGLALSGFPLGVACTTCGHRALVEAAKVGARDGNMTEIRHLKLRCTECDGTAFEGTIFSAQEQVDDFLAVVSAARPGF